MLWSSRLKSADPLSELATFKRLPITTSNTRMLTTSSLPTLPLLGSTGSFPPQTLTPMPSTLSRDAFDDVWEFASGGNLRRESLNRTLALCFSSLVPEGALASRAIGQSPIDHWQLQYVLLFRLMPAVLHPGDIASQKSVGYGFSVANRRLELVSSAPCEISAVLAERLRRMLKAHVRKSVGSIPTDRSVFAFFSRFVTGAMDWSGFMIKEQ